MKFIVFFILFLLPFVVAPFGATYFETPKVILFEASVLLLLVLAVFTKKLTFQPNAPQLCLVGLIATLAIGHALFFKTDLSLFGNATRLQGTFLLWCLFLFAFLARTISLPGISWKWYGLLLLAQLAVLPFLPLTASNRYVGTLGEPNALAAFALFVWPFAFFGLPAGRLGTLSKVGLVALVGVIIFLTGSKSGLVGFLLQLAFICLRHFKLTFSKAAMVCLGLYFASYLLPFFSQVVYENRVDVWRAAIHAGSTSPLLGHGFGNQEVALAHSAQELNLPLQYVYVDSAHNIFLDWWVEGGAIGLGALVALVALTFKAFIREGKVQETILLLGLLTALSFNPASVVGLIGFWWLIGRGWNAAAGRVG